MPLRYLHYIISKCGDFVTGVITIIKCILLFIPTNPLLHPRHLLRGDRTPRPELWCSPALNTQNRRPEWTHPYGPEASAARWLSFHLNGILDQTAVPGPPCFRKRRMNGKAASHVSPATLHYPYAEYQIEIRQHHRSKPNDNFRKRKPGRTETMRSTVSIHSKPFSLWVILWFHVTGGYGHLLYSVVVQAVHTKMPNQESVLIVMIVIQTCSKRLK